MFIFNCNEQNLILLLHERHDSLQIYYWDVLGNNLHYVINSSSFLPQYF